LGTHSSLKPFASAFGSRAKLDAVDYGCVSRPDKFVRAIRFYPNQGSRGRRPSNNGVLNCFGANHHGRRKLGTDMHFRRTLPEMRCLSPVCPTREMPSLSVGMGLHPRTWMKPVAHALLRAANFPRICESCINGGADPLVRAGPPGPASRQRDQLRPHAASRRGRRLRTGRPPHHLCRCPPMEKLCGIAHSCVPRRVSLDARALMIAVSPA
jgi:hypothetical protein